MVPSSFRIYLVDTKNTLSKIQTDTRQTKMLSAVCWLQAKAQKELGNIEDSYKTLEKALQVSRKIGDQAGTCSTQHFLSI